MKYLKTYEFNKPTIKSLPIGVDKNTLYSYVSFIANQLGEELLQYKNIGSGQFGTAFMLKSGKVLKLTSDMLEAMTAYYLSDKNTEFVVNYYDVRRIVGSKDKNLYVIIMDYAEPVKMSEKEKYLWYLDEKYLDCDVDEFIKNMNYPWKITENVISYLKHFWYNMIGMLQELKELGIKNADIHSDNLGMINGKMILFDVTGLYHRNEFKKKKREFYSIVPKLNVSKFFK